MILRKKQREERYTLGWKNLELTPIFRVSCLQASRLIDCGGWKGIGKKSSNSVVGRWEIHLPAHKTEELVKLDFTIDKGKKRSK